jgi:hypothetical protein
MNAHVFAGPRAARPTFGRCSLALGAFTAVSVLGALGPFGRAAYAQESGNRGNNWGGAPAAAPAATAAPAEGAGQPEATEAKADAPKPEVAEGKAVEKKAAGAKVEAKAAGAKAGAKKEGAVASASNFVRGRFQFEVGVGTQARSFGYLQPRSIGSNRDNVRPYGALITPHFVAQADAFPLAGPGDSWGNHLGLTASVGGSVGQKSTLSGGQRSELETGVSTTFFHFRAGPKLRFALGSGDKASLLTAEVAYSRWAFTFDDASGSSPSFVYQSIRPGIGARVPAGPVALLFEGGFHAVTDAGALSARFPNASVHGFDTQLGLALPISRAFEGRVSLNYNRYRGNLRAELNPNAPTATPYLAAGSVDQFFGARFGVAVAP